MKRFICTATLFLSLAGCTGLSPQDRAMIEQNRTISLDALAESRRAAQSAAEASASAKMSADAARTASDDAAVSAAAAAAASEKANRIFLRSGSK